jgi:uncharacterized membrane protein YdjX (TVP38/TMEM64 family)
MTSVENPRQTTDLRRRRKRAVVIASIVAVGLVLYLQSGIRDIVSLEHVRELGNNPYAPALIIIAMAGAWAFALPASMFFFITPLLFPPLPATIIVSVGSALGSGLGYAAAFYGISPWVRRFNDSRVVKLLSLHSSFASLFAIRIVPGSPHMVINYAAGVVRIPFVRFILATMIAIGIKGFLYATAIDEGASASSVDDVLNWRTVSALFGLAALAMVGHLLQKRWRRKESAEASSPVR